eukprot:g2061.t1
MDTDDRELCVKTRRKLRNKLRMRERRKDPAYKARERQRQAEARANRSRVARISPRTNLPIEVMSGSGESNQTESNRPYTLVETPELYTNDVSVNSQAPQLPSTHTVQRFPPQVVPVEVPFLEADPMHEATCVVSLPSVSSTPHLPAVVRMAILPPVPSIINFVIVPSDTGTDEGLNKNSTSPTDSGKTQLETQFPSSNTINTSQMFQLDDSGDFLYQSNDMTTIRNSKRCKFAEDNSSSAVGQSTNSSRGRDLRTPA